MFSGPFACSKLRAICARLVDRVIVQPRELDRPLRFDIHGKLNELLAPAAKSGGLLVPPA